MSNENIARLERAFNKAHEAGNVEDAKHFAKVLREMEKELSLSAPQSLANDEEIQSLRQHEQQVQLADEMSGAQAFGTAAGSALTRIGDGIAQIPSAALASFNNPLQERAQQNLQSINQSEAQRVNANVALSESHPIAAGSGNLLGDIAGTALIPGGAAKQFHRRIGGAAFAGGASEAIKPGDAQERFQRGTAGAAGGVLSRAGIDGVSKLTNIKRGNLPTDATEMLALAQANGKTLTLGELLDNTTIKEAEIALENVPLVGLSKHRQAEFVNDQKIINALEGNLKKDAMDASNAINNVADNPDEVIKLGLTRFLNKEKARADTLYKRVSSLAGNKPVKATKLQETAKNLLGRKGLINEEGAQVSIPGLDSKLQAYSQGVTGSFQGLRDIRTQLGDMLKDPSNPVGTQGQRSIERLRKAIDSDLENHAVKTGGDLHKAWRTADKHYKNVITKFSDKDIAKTFTANDDVAFRHVIQAKKYTAFNKMYAAGDQATRKAMRWSIISDSIEKATDADGNLIPASFALKMAGHQGKIKGMPKEFQNTVKGINKLMRATKRNSSYKKELDSPTGNRTARLLPTIAAVAGTVTGHGDSVLLKGGGMALVSRLATTSPNIQKFIIAASKVRPESAEMGKILDGLEKAVVRASKFDQAEEQRKSDIQQTIQNVGQSGAF